MLDTVKKTGIICTGNNRKKVIANKTVTYEDDQTAQRHDKLWTVDIYSTLGPAYVAVWKHCHDNDASLP